MSTTKSSPPTRGRSYTSTQVARRRRWPGITVVGAVDLPTVPLFRDRLITVLHDETPAVVDIDLAGGFVLGLHRGLARLSPCAISPSEADARCGSPIPDPPSGRVLDLTGLLNVLTAPIDQPEQLPPEFVTQPVPDPPPRQRHSRPT